MIEDDAIGVVCPCYNVEMPMMVRDFMRKAHLKTDYFFFVYTYGEGIAESFAHAKLAAEEAGLTQAYVNAIQMVDMSLPAAERRLFLQDGEAYPCQMTKTMR